MNETRDFFGDVSNTIYNILGPGEWYWKSSRVFDDDAFDVRKWKFGESKNSLEIIKKTHNPSTSATYSEASRQEARFAHHAERLDFSKTK